MIVLMTPPLPYAKLSTSLAFKERIKYFSLFLKKIKIENEFNEFTS